MHIFYVIIHNLCLCLFVFHKDCQSVTFLKEAEPCDAAHGSEEPLVRM